MSDKVYHWIFKEIKINKKLKDYFRLLPMKYTESIDIMRIGEDVIVTDTKVNLHTDNTTLSKDTVMLVMDADRHVFIHENCEITIQAGSVIRFDGNKKHGLYQMVQKSIFSAIIWDVPIYLSIDDLLFDFQDRLKQLTKEATNPHPINGNLKQD